MNIIYHHRTRGRGAEGVHIMGIVNAFRSRGHQVDLLSMPGANPEDMNDDSPAKQDNDQTRSWLGRLMSLTRYLPEFAFELAELLYNLVASRRLKAALRDRQVDLIYERYSLFLFAGIRAARKAGIPIILEVNDSAIVERVRPLFFQRVAKSIERRVFQQADGLIFISNYFREKAEAAFGTIAPSEICPNAADISQFNRDKFDRDAIRERLGLSGKVVCGYVGAFVYWHGIDWFMKLIIPRLDEVPNLYLLLVGDGVVYEPIRAMVSAAGMEDRVVMTGRVAHDEVADHVAAMDFGILPDSNLYGSPMKLFEMMAMGVASVCPGFGPIREVVDHQATGWIFEPGDKEAAVSQVLEVAADEAHVRQIGERARAYIVAERQWVHNTDAILRLLDS